MEILTYIVSGELAHRDSMDNTAIIRPGIVQRMSAGTGIAHAEFNPSSTTPVHLLQIWLQPDAPGHAPSYEELTIGTDGAANRLLLVAGPDASAGGTTWHQDARLYAAKPARGCELALDLAPGRHAWVQLISGEVTLNGTLLTAGDGAAVSDELRLRVQAEEDSEFLLFDLA
jgi:redox-sensitive bicupin YhaK (pirin superfamily)